MNRECGDCQLCCRLLPVKNVINKPALTRCKHQRHGKGCAVYHKPEKGFPWECGAWSCVWLQGGDAAELRRPDRSHYVIDIMPDFVIKTDPDGTKTTIPVVQIWCDPKYPNAHRDPALRAWLMRRRGLCGLVRYGNDDTILIVPPHMNETGEWFEKGGNVRGESHSFGQVLEALSGAA